MSTITHAGAEDAQEVLTFLERYGLRKQGSISAGALCCAHLWDQLRLSAH